MLQNGSPIRAFPVPPPGDVQRPGGRDRFEHMLITAHPQEDGWQAHTVNGQEIPNWFAGPELSHYLASWGEDGWETTGMGIADGVMTILLKRRWLTWGN